MTNPRCEIGMELRATFPNFQVLFKQSTHFEFEIILYQALDLTAYEPSSISENNHGYVWIQISPPATIAVPLTGNYSVFLYHHFFYGKMENYYPCCWLQEALEGLTWSESYKRYLAHSRYSINLSPARHSPQLLFTGLKSQYFICLHVLRQHLATQPRMASSS